MPLGGAALENPPDVAICGVFLLGEMEHTDEF